jgi:hypothetical protein
MLEPGKSSHHGGVNYRLAAESCIVTLRLRRRASSIFTLPLAELADRTSQQQIVVLDWEDSVTRTMVCRQEPRPLAREYFETPP